MVQLNKHWTTSWWTYTKYEIRKTCWNNMKKSAINKCAGQIIMRKNNVETLFYTVEAHSKSTVSMQDQCHRDDWGEHGCPTFWLPFQKKIAITSSLDTYILQAVWFVVMVNTVLAMRFLPPVPGCIYVGRCSISENKHPKYHTFATASATLRAMPQTFKRAKHWLCFDSTEHSVNYFTAFHEHGNHMYVYTFKCYLFSGSKNQFLIIL